MDQICDLTQGWVSGLTLFQHAFQDLSSGDIRKCIVQPNSLPDPVDDYLEEEVFSALAPEIKDFLLRTSILTRLHASFCDQWLGIDASQSILTHLATHHLFIQKQVGQGDGYVYHHLFRIFLQNRLAAHSSTEVLVDLHRKAAVLYEGLDGIEEALPGEPALRVGLPG